MGIIVWLVRGCNFWTTKVMSLCSDGILFYIRGMVYCRGERIDYRNDAADFFFFSLSSLALEALEVSIILYVEVADRERERGSSRVMLHCTLERNFSI